MGRTVEEIKIYVDVIATRWKKTSRAMSELTKDLKKPSLITDLKEALEHDGITRWIQEGDRVKMVWNGITLMEGPADEMWEDQGL